MIMKKMTLPWANQKNQRHGLQNGVIYYDLHGQNGWGWAK